MRVERIWAMPNKHTFQIKPIRELLKEEMGDGLWIDPFCGESNLANIRNDLNPAIEADWHIDALDFLREFKSESVDGVLYDPPYSPRQIAECYESVGMSTMGGLRTRATFWSNTKDEVARIIKPNGKAICCGWNSMGVGLGRGFEMIRILLVPHGGHHNDTIVTVEVKEVV